MSSNIETPEGWQPSGPCFTRVYGGKFAVLQPHPHRDRFRARVYEAGAYEVSTESALPLPDAVAWANEQLGVPKPVEVVRTEYKDAWILTCEQTGRSWRVSKDVQCRDYVDVQAAIEMGEKYVRGDA